MTSGYPQEIELKLSLPPGKRDAFRAWLARKHARPVVRALTTRYLDTPDFALGALGVALRLRRVGRRWLQTLKTEGERQGGLSRRVEFEMPVPRGEVDWTRFPPAAQDCVPVRLRDRLAPVFETRFTRTAWQLGGAGGAAIEVALDVGEVRAGDACAPICEIELELKSGEPDALYDLALDWARRFDCLPFDPSKAERGMRLARGVADAPLKSAPARLERATCVEDGFAAICRACLTQFQANLPGVLAPHPNPLPQAGEGANVMPTPSPLPNPLPQAGEGANGMPTPGPLPNPLPQAGEGANVMPTPNNEYVHQARVALRRLRAALRLYRRVCVLPPELAAGLRALAAALGPVRDLDVLCDEILPPIAPQYDDAGRWQAGRRVLEARRIAGRAAMRAALTAAHPGAWLLGCHRWLLLRGWRAAPEARRFVQRSPLADWAARALRRGHRAVLRDARRFAAMSPSERHALRIRVKRQRYAAEFFAPLYPGRAHVRYRACLSAAQEGLGRANDVRMAVRVLQSLRPALSDMGAFARGWLTAREAGAHDGKNAKHLKNFVKLRVDW